jgi:apoptosis-inducing factor 3
LRSFDDTDDVIEAAKNESKIVIIGSSFIALEAASSLRKRINADITVIGLEDIPFKNVFGEEIGTMIKTVHEKNGIKFKLKNSAVKFEGQTKVEKVILSNGESLDVDIVLVGIGVKPATSFLTGFNLEKNGSINVNNYFGVEENIYAAGDIVNFHNSITNTQMRIEHWRTAEQQGRIAGFNMAGQKTEFKSVPFFWTVQAGIALRYVGHADKWNEIITWGDIQSHNFISFYFQDDLLFAAAGCGYVKEMDAIEALMVMKKVPSKAQIKNKSINLFELLK